MNNEKRERAIKWLVEEVRSLRMAPVINGCGPENWAEQLREMDGKPVWINDLGKLERSGWRLLYWDRGKYLVLLAKSATGYLLEDYGKTWIAYAYPPTHIDREAWEPCKLCSGAKYVYGHASAVVQNEDKGQIETEVEGDFDYCPECGRPLTPEAWDEMEKRLRW